MSKFYRMLEVIWYIGVSLLLLLRLLNQSLLNWKKKLFIIIFFYSLHFFDWNGMDTSKWMNFQERKTNQHLKMMMMMMATTTTNDNGWLAGWERERDTTGLDFINFIFYIQFMDWSFFSFFFYFFTSEANLFY